MSLFIKSPGIASNPLSRHVPDENRAVLHAIDAVAILWLFYLALQPFAWSFEPADMLQRLREGLSFSSGHWLMHALAGVVMGGLLALTGRDTPTTQLRALFILFFALEVAQAFVSYRHPRPSDFCIRLLTGSITILLLGWLRAKGFGQQLSASGASRVARGLAVGGALTLGLWLVEAARVTRLTSWEPSYPLIIGNERTGDRPWLGCIRGFALYDRAIDARDVCELGNLPFAPGFVAPRTRLGASLLYSFGTGSDDPTADLIQGVCLGPMGVKHDLSAKGLCLSKQLDMEHPVGLCADHPPEELTKDLVHHAEFSIELQCSSALSKQNGPARIISFSLDLFHRNFTVGQEDSHLIWRVRSLQGGLNGTGNVAMWEDVFATDRDQRLFLTYARGQVLLYRDGEARHPDFLAQVANPLSHLARFPFWAVTLFMLPTGVFFCLGWRTARPFRLAVLASVGTCLVVLAGEGVGHLISGGPRIPWIGFFALVAVPAGIAGAQLQKESRHIG